MNSIYESLSKETQEAIKQNLSKKQLESIDRAIRRDENHDRANIWRPGFIRDVEKIMHNPYYNRYTDKTQVFSFYKNDDLSRRALHVQFVSRIARNIGRLLDLDLDLIEAISLGHDLGHTPFGHAGESYLNELYHGNTGRFFNHNVHSVRVLDGIFHLNISLQVLDGILCHNGEFECKEYKPSKLDNFSDFDKKVEECYVDETAIERLVPSTLEGCVVRISDMIAYVGKDRQDAKRAKLIEDESIFQKSSIGTHNAAIINNLIVNIIENSYKKPYILLDDEHFNALKLSKKENYELIYKNEVIAKRYTDEIKPMFERVYNELYHELLKGDKTSVIYKHHISLVNEYNKHYQGVSYEENDPHRIVCDFIASMTDDYMIDLYSYLFPKAPAIEYVSYFE